MDRATTPITPLISTPNLFHLKIDTMQDSFSRARESNLWLLFNIFGQMDEIYTLRTQIRKKYRENLASGKQSGKKLFLFDKMLVPKDFT